MLLKKINIMVAHNDPTALKSIAHTIENNRFMKLVGTACSGLELLEKSYLYHPDVIITDLYLNTLSGVVGAEFIHQYFPFIGLIAYHYVDCPFLYSSIIAKGYRGLIMPSDEESETIKAIYSVVLGGDYYSDDFFCMLDWFSFSKMINQD